MNNRLNKKSFYLLAVLTVFLLMSASIGIVFGWFFYGSMIGANDITARTISRYYAGGTGTVNDPYVIKKPKHLYNLAWLQYKGRYQEEKVYFKVDDDIDMDGLAIPPIGTEKNPFLGDFDGNGKTISNVFVSTIVTELQSEYVSHDFDPGKNVGFFGTIECVYSESDSAYTLVGIAGDFYLENLLISTATPDSVVGLICGYVNGSLENIGVSNCKIKLGSGINSDSGYSLIGEKGEDALWKDEPGLAGGGDLVINPNGSPKFTNINTADPPRAVSGAIDDQAFYVGALAVASPSNKNGPYTYNGTTRVTINTGANSTANKDFLIVYNALPNGGYTAIQPGTAPTSTSVTSVYMATLGRSVNLPRNSIWFKPKGPGTGAVAFTVTNNSADASGITLYRFKRNSSNGIIDFENYLTFVMQKDKNGDCYYFEFSVTMTDIRAGYEYCIGGYSSGGTIVGYKSYSPSASASLLYLMLAGVNIEGAPEVPIENIDYVYRANGNGAFPDMSLTTYTSNNTKLTYTGTTTALVVIHYNQDAFAATHYVYYCVSNGSFTGTNTTGTTGSNCNGITVTEAITTGYVSRPAVYDERFHAFDFWHLVDTS